MILFITIAIVTVYGLNALAMAYIIGKPRKPLTAGQFFVNLAYSALMVAGVLYLASH